MTAQKRQLHLNAFIHGTGHHEASWRHPEVDPLAEQDIAHYIAIARTAERGKLDSLFLADGLAISSNIRFNAYSSFEPLTLLSALATATERIGLIATASTTYNQPYSLARALASVDRISSGRAGWNIVTSAGQGEAKNFNLADRPAHALRYERAHEFLDTAKALWDSWADDAVVADQASGIYSDAGKIHPIDHQGKHFQVKGPLNLPRSPQGRPVLVQAGSSEGGKALGSRYADAIFTTQTSLEDGQHFYRDMKQRARQWGRNPEHLKIMPGLSTVIGSSEAEAHARFDQLNAYHGEHGLIQQVAARIGIPAQELELDAPLPWARIGEVGTYEKGSQGFLEAQLNLARREGLTVRELSRRILVGHRLLVGTPEQVADTLEHWFLAGAADGFNIMPDMFPSGVEVFVDEVVPLLRKRGVFRHEYSGSTLREHLGLPYPQSQYARSLA